MKLYQRIIFIFTSLVIVGSFVLFVSGVAAYLYLAPGLPDVDTLREVRLQVPLRVYTRDGRLISQLGAQRRIPVEFDQIPDSMVEAFLAAEDDRFYQHPGVDYQGLARATMMLMLTGERRQGGGTITMQLARNYFLTSERTYVRKLREIFLALRIERLFTKQEILTLYLNKIFLGQRAYGVGAASEVYFGKPLADLDLSQIATIAGLPKAPSADNPVTNPERATVRRNYVLRRMREVGFIDEPMMIETIERPVESRLHGPTVEVRAPYVAEMVRTELESRGLPDIYTAGYRVTTSVDSKMQRAAIIALRQALLEYDARHGYKGPEGRIDLLTGEAIPLIDPDDETATEEIVTEQVTEESLALIDEAIEEDTDTDEQPVLTGEALWDQILEPYPEIGSLDIGLVTSVDDKQADVYVRGRGHIVLPWTGLSWARSYIEENVRGEEPEAASDVLTPGDIVRLAHVTDGWRLTQIPEVQGALVALDPLDGAIVALSGGFDYFASKYNRAAQAKRQPGSSFKPFIYAAAIDKGFTPATTVNDAPIVIEDSQLEDVYKPTNYGDGIYGPTRLREGLIKSRNLVAIRVLRQLGIRYSLNYLERFGFPRSALPANLSLALGSASLTPLQMATAYTVFANGGFKTEPYLIQRIEDANGELLFLADPTLACVECEAVLAGRVDHDAPVGTNGDGDEAGEEHSVPVPPVEIEVDIDALVDDPNNQIDTEMLASRVIDSRNAYLVADMMRDVITQGTGRRATALGRSDLSGKTGTTNEGVDVWFSGYNAGLVATAWVGFDEPRSLGFREEGSRTALPMWIDFMKVALDGVPEKQLPAPNGLCTVRISRQTGKLASVGAANTMFEIVPCENMPEPEAGEFLSPDEIDEPDEDDLF